MRSISQQKNAIFKREKTQGKQARGYNKILLNNRDGISVLRLKAHRDLVGSTRHLSSGTHLFSSHVLFVYTILKYHSVA